VQAGVIDATGQVDDVVRDWMTVLGRPDRQVVLVIRRPAGEQQGAPIVHERVVVVCRHRRRWMAMAARDGDEVVIDAVGEADGPDEQVQLMCAPLLAAFGEAPPAPIEGVNLAADLLQSTLERTGAHSRDAVAAAMGRLGLRPVQAEILTAPPRRTSRRWP
jgi:hypothetical protein